MSVETLRDEDTHTIEYDDELNALIHTWNTFSSGETFREGANELLSVFTERDVSKLIIDTTEVKAHDEEDKQWLQEVWLPNMIDVGLAASVNVHRESVIAEMDMQETVDPLEDEPFENFMTDDMDEAREWLAEQ
ncbi:conserved hypothetical protein [Halorhabdus utahensis DSM 12940]|uniref:STAS/SEC14 domain-containing protein n=1 Tax=Halorhabdus utahensis (strain DSM 12940 / JCM 11049 / AX-2) TaxID=519442 RepID=C7NNR5_HALUD|nr:MULTISPECIES: hypothetical protein [Halorhabdus]ACV11590.1 conserved hypothetical protein [Halorhabdus utahensis DSM 12940]WEL16401.1 Uncharacterized protein SVXHr_0216 [Halorhabdus sp. SVX81]